MNKTLDAASPSPLQDGFGWPAEWEPHQRTWMCWPARGECFGGAEGMLRAKQAYARVARAISAFEPVTLAARGSEVAEAKLATGGKVEVVEMALDDSWARDFGPTFLKNGTGRLSGVQWVFNAWGQKYHPYTNDATFARRVLEAIGAGVYAAPLICEGGALNSDGQGTLLTTEQCLLNRNRNPGRSREEVEEVLGQYLGIRKVIWLGNGFSDVETDGHVDNIACFASPGRVILGIPAKSHPDYPAVQEAKSRLKAARDAQGRELEIVCLPQPKKLRTSWSGRLLAMSYVNFYLANGAVIMPAFEDANDESARTILAQCFPGRDIMQIHALDIVQGGGGIHCVTQQGAPSVSEVALAAVQFSCSWDRAANIAKAKAFVRQAAEKGANIVLLPELFETPYFCQDQSADHFALSQPFEGNTLIAEFASLAKELSVVLPLSFFERAHHAHFNALAVIDADGRVLGRYRKSHIPDGPGYQEKFYFHPGETGFRAWPAKYGKVGAAICWDQWFPEAARIMALKGAEMLFYPTAIGSEPPPSPPVNSRDHWRRVMQGHAAANYVPLVAANRIGIEKGGAGELRFYGSSFIAGPTGEIVAELGRDEEGLILARFDLANIAKARASWGLFRDRRPDLYGPLLTADGGET